MKQYIKPEIQTLQVSSQAVMAGSLNDVGVYGTGGTAASKRNYNPDFVEESVW